MLGLTGRTRKFFLRRPQCKRENFWEPYVKKDYKFKIFGREGANVFFFFFGGGGLQFLRSLDPLKSLRTCLYSF